MIKTFRGILADGGQNKIRLSTKKGKIGYRIEKLQVMGQAPGATSQESIVKILKVKQSTIDGNIDFADGNLLAAAIWFNKSSVDFPVSEQIIFDREIFNQDIYITHSEVDSTEACNYYLELETINMTDNAAAVSTLRDIRLNPQVGA